MRKTGYLLLLVLAVILSACQKVPENRELKQYTFYYLSGDENGSTVVAEEVRSLDERDALQVMDIYMRGPEDPENTSPFPAGCIITEASQEDDTLTLELSKSFYRLSGLDSTLARACLTKTARSVTGCTGVRITGDGTEGELLTQEMFQLDITQEEVHGSQVTLYYADKDSGYLVPETRSIVSGISESNERYILDQLLKDPGVDGLTTVMPEGTTLKSVETVDGVCTVNFSKEFYDNRPETQFEEQIVIFSVVNSLTSLENVSKVRILIEGRGCDIYRYMSISGELEAYDGIVGPVNTSRNQLAVSLYVQSWSPDYLAALPSTVSRKVNIATEEQLLQMLIDFEPPVGYSNPIPQGTTINSVSVSDGLCIVDLSQEFTETNGLSPEIQKLSVMAIVATVSQLDYISSVKILIDGESSGLDYVNLNEPLITTEDMLFPQ